MYFNEADRSPILAAVQQQPFLISGHLRVLKRGCVKSTFTFRIHYEVALRPSAVAPSDLPHYSKTSKFQLVATLFRLEGTLCDNLDLRHSTARMKPETCAIL